MSTLHLCMKYSVGGGVGTMRVDQQVSSQCYEDSLKARGRGKDRWMEGREVRPIYAKNRPRLPMSSFIHYTRNLTHIPKEKKTWQRKKESSKGRDKQVANDMFHQGGPVSNLACQHSDDGASRYNLLSFMDAYSECNQIRMHPQDEAKTAFVTDNRSFCYKMMPFILKNAWATYQRLMDKIFKDHIDRELEVYVDNMVIKSTTKERHCEALA
ncbi:Retrovirus-related Pol polyprotein from transposon 17.6, partial [Mucuna pruriens]